MEFHLDLIEDKVEFFEALSLPSLERQVAEKIEQNKAILLAVHSVTHQLQFDPDGRKHYSAAIHFKVKK